MPISAVQRDRLENALQGHEAALSNSDEPPSPLRARVHATMVQLGRDEDVLTLVSDFMDSPTLVDELRADGAAVLRDRGISLPEGVTMQVVDGYGGDPPPILRLVLTVRSLTLFADWDPRTGASVRARAPFE
ncbi:hypothetical protein ACIOHS_42890 [Streptomyces sp. NPDC088253]|uniref:hypothetical protein n=1 Tax=Streptomyces sp. NPDC088253 TaxID=3365846 RepID=UPI003812E784